MRHCPTLDLESLHIEEGVKFYSEVKLIKDYRVKIHFNPAGGWGGGGGRIFIFIFLVVYF